MGVPAAPPPPAHPKIFPASLPHLRIAVGFIHGIAIIATIFRVYWRRHKNKLGLDDILAGFACFWDILFMITFMLRNNNAGAATGKATHNAYIALNWFQNILGPTVLWLSRLSILIGINRLITPGRRLKIFTRYLPFFFIALYLGVISAKIWACSGTTKWHHSASMQCYLAQPVPDIEITFDIVADIILIALPTLMLWEVKLNRKTRRRVVFIFCTSILITLANINYNVFVFGAIHWGGTVIVSVSGHIEAAIALLVCNLSVLLPLVFRLINRNGKDPESQPTHTSDKGTGLETSASATRYDIELGKQPTKGVDAESEASEPAAGGSS